MKKFSLYFTWGLCAGLVVFTSSRVLASDSILCCNELSLTPSAPSVTEDSTPQFLDVPGPSLDISSSSQPSTLSTRDKIAATQPEANSAVRGEFPEPGGAFGLGEFIRHFAPYEPMYFVGGTKAPNVKFQFSLRYRIFNPDAPLAVQYPLLKGFNFAYSQTSLWDFSDSNDPFFYDSSYRPEFFYYLENVPALHLPPSWQAGLQAGIGHESNGQKDPNHRSLNILYLRPILTLSATRGDLFLIVAPKAYVYIGGLPLNPDMPKYRGYCDLRVVFGQRDGLELSTIGRLGSDFDKGSLQFDLTYPLTKLLGGNVDVSLDAQYFIGYGDTLLTYNRYSQIFRVGLALVR